MKPSRTLLAITCGVRQFYLGFKIRIRQWGHLPEDRGATVLITNHQHMDEGENIIGRTFFLHPHKPLVMCNSRRTFETGFIAARLPWSARFTRGVNLSWLWARYGIFPIENHLFSRPLISLAEELRASRGDLPLADFLPVEVLESLGVNGLRIGDLWKLEHFMAAQGWVRVSQLKQPYRREVLENLRATTQRDIADIVEYVRGGATFYITPEGDFSHDGRLRPMRGGIVEALAPHADLWLCAIAYDPFQGRRLEMLYRVVKHTGVADVGTELAAARPVTTAALLAPFLRDGPETFGREDAVRAARERLAELPGNVFVDPELRADPQRAVGRMLAVLRARGILEQGAYGYRLTGRSHDARFPHVADMIDFQANMLEETIASARRIADSPVLVS